MSIEQSIRESLTARAGAVGADALSGPALRDRARAQRRRHVVVGAVATLVLVLVGVLTVPMASRRASLPPAATGVDSWPVRGDLAGDTALAAAAERAWEAAPIYRAELPHREVRVLFAGSTPFGRYVMLTGYNALGHRRLAVFSDDPRDAAPYAKRLRLRSDQAFPDHKLLTYVDRGVVGGSDRLLIVAIGPPDVTGMQWRDEADWHPLRSQDGAAAMAFETSVLETRVRAFRGERRVADQRVYQSYRRLYYPDEDLVVEGDVEPDCRGGVCTASVGGSISVAPLGSGSLTATQPVREGDWEDMADQAVQLWHNRAAPPGAVTSTTHGPVWSGLLPDGTGLNLFRASVNGGPQHFVLYVDRPDWPGGRLYLARPVPDGDVPAISVVLPGDQLAVIVAEGVTAEYQVSGGEWTRLAVRDGIAHVRLPGTDPAGVRIRITHAGRSQILPPDSTASLPPA